MHNDVEYGQPGERSSTTSISMPAPTVQPLVLALGLLLVFAGIIFHPYLTYLGLVVALAAAVGWWRSVIPFESMETVSIDSRHRPSGITVRSNAAPRRNLLSQTHYAGNAGEFHSYGSGALGGLAGGAAMAILACLYGLIAQHSLWYPINLLAGMVVPSIGSETLEQLRSFDGTAFFAALAGHVALSALVGVLYAAVLPMFPKYAPFWAGILMPFVWTALVATLLNLLNPALNDRISWSWFVVCQLGFGFVCGYVVTRSARVNDIQSRS